jgi:hypothetical protein
LLSLSVTSGLVAHNCTPIRDPAYVIDTLFSGCVAITVSRILHDRRLPRPEDRALAIRRSRDATTDPHRFSMILLGSDVFIVTSETNLTMIVFRGLCSYGHIGKNEEDIGYLDQGKPFTVGDVEAVG